MNKQRILKIISILFFSLICITSYAYSNGDSDSINYRGKRELKDTGDFTLLSISCKRLDSASVQIDLYFNQQLEPNSASGASFSVNGSSKKASGKPEFSKDGKRLRIKLPVTEKSFTFEVRGVKSYNGKTVKGCRISAKDNGDFRAGN